ncbi:holo-ACP synthase [Leptolyngbya sp. O-77]|uniref:holo-ACP synthase n=1 Tax=Leptolyngbya sp. O-77 TaxID=1080068 RepID=UPI00074D2A44|nr:holo-ACP synthase [Leptolyngbya sp. O-77]BAU41134.1 Holo-[acyl-carrier-protein] synthase [Leptolyngbya sp. O-77]
MNSSLNISLGTDIVHIPRIRALIDRFGDRFLKKVYTVIEQQDYWQACAQAIENQVGITRLAGRWAAKEAVVKAMGTGWRGIRYTDIEIQRQGNGAPTVCLHGTAAQWATQVGGGNWRLSLSHDGEYAIATALFLGLAAE